MIANEIRCFQMLLEKLNGTKPVLADSTTIADLTADENLSNTGKPGLF